MTYQSDLIKHLSAYKLSRLGITEPGLYAHRGRNIPYDHILPLNLSERNLFDEALPTARELFVSRKKHKYFHHLNSSQAFAFNLFCPYFGGNDVHAASSLLRALGQSTTLISWDLEAIPDRGEGSNIDGIWTTADGCKTFCEVKLAEAEFGKAKDDLDHRKKFEQIYAAVLQSHFSEGLIERKAFFEAYQIYRNVWHMVRDKAHRLVFLLPRANRTLWPILDKTIAALRPETKARVSIVAIEDVLSALSSDPTSPPMYRDYAKKLAEKYLPQGVGELGVEITLPPAIP